MLIPYLAGLTPKAQVALVVAIPVLYYLSYTIQVARRTHPAWAPSWHPSHSSQDFVERWLATELIGPFDGPAIREFCATATWRPNVILNLHSARGGIANVRAMVLDFLFKAVDLGAAIVLPGMTVRNDDDLSDYMSGPEANFSRMFDESHFLTTMQDVCPGLRIYQPSELSSELVVEGMYRARDRREDWDATNTREALQESLDTWLLDRKVDVKDTKTQVVVNVEPLFWEIDVRRLPSTLRTSFPKLLRIHPAIRRFAGLAMASMISHYAVPIDPSDAIHERAYYGAHLRTEYDAQVAGWSDATSETEMGLDFDGQTDAYLEHAEREGLRIIYVATGNASEFTRFVDKAAIRAPQMSIVSKYTLLALIDEFDSALFDQLAFDQQALIDYEILQRCSIFGGFAKSSFSYTVALARNARLEYVMGKRSARTAWYMREVDKSMEFDDGLSRIVGRCGIFERLLPNGQWP